MLIDPDTMTAIHIGQLRPVRVLQNVVAPVARAREAVARATIVFRSRRRGYDRANGATVPCQE